jgi:hypothetical protein
VGAAECGDDTHSDRLADAEGVADGEYDVAHLERIGAAEGDCVKLAVGLDLQHGQVGFGVAADDARGQLASVVESYLDFIGGFNDVVVGKNVAFR